MESNGLNRIFANKRNSEKGLGISLFPELILISSIKPISSSISLALKEEIQKQ